MKAKKRDQSLKEDNNFSILLQEQREQAELAEIENQKKKS
jgi:hypothetical protein